MEMSSKINAEHLKRTAYLYVRQSTVRQVFENTESTKRQYGLRQRAVALGWPQERIEIIDTDLGVGGSKKDTKKGNSRAGSDEAGVLKRSQYFSSLIS
jgi:hypothetical protein